MNQVAYSFSMTEEMAPFLWDETMDKLFEKAKVQNAEKVVEGVKHFEMNRNKYLATDFSKTGVGFCLASAGLSM